MKIVITLVAAALASACSSAPIQSGGAESIDVLVEPPAPTDASPQHRWLLSLVGEWKGTSSDVGEAQPGADPVQWTFTEVIKPVGELWVVTEGASSGGEDSFSSRFTLGYDVAQGKFVGSWVDSMQTTQWTYTGELDAAQRVLSLYAEGPSMTTPGETATYRDQLVLVDANHKRMVSSVEGDNGEWQTYMTVEFVRTK
ncbi:MAG: DUF1579 domain-containing protein [Planctomycetota bacterium]